MNESVWINISEFNLMEQDNKSNYLSESFRTNFIPRVDDIIFTRKMGKSIVKQIKINYSDNQKMKMIQFLYLFMLNYLNKL